MPAHLSNNNKGTAGAAAFQTRNSSSIQFGSINEQQQTGPANNVNSSPLISSPQPPGFASGGTLPLESVRHKSNNKKLPSFGSLSSDNEKEKQSTPRALPPPQHPSSASNNNNTPTRPAQVVPGSPARRQPQIYNNNNNNNNSYQMRPQNRPNGGQQQMNDYSSSGVPPYRQQQSPSGMPPMGASHSPQNIHTIPYMMNDLYYYHPSFTQQPRQMPGQPFTSADPSLMYMAAAAAAAASGARPPPPPPPPPQPQGYPDHIPRPTYSPIPPPQQPPTPQQIPHSPYSRNADRLGTPTSAKPRASKAIKIINPLTKEEIHTPAPTAESVASSTPPPPAPAAAAPPPPQPPVIPTPAIRKNTLPNQESRSPSPLKPDTSKPILTEAEKKERTERVKAEFLAKIKADYEKEAAAAKEEEQVKPPVVNGDEKKPEETVVAEKPKEQEQEKPVESEPEAKNEPEPEQASQTETEIVVSETETQVVSETETQVAEPELEKAKKPEVIAEAAEKTTTTTTTTPTAIETIVESEVKAVPEPSSEAKPEPTVAKKPSAPSRKAVPIKDFSKVEYPESIQKPQDISSSHLHYSIAFLKQFQEVCTAKPRDDWDEFVKSLMGDDRRSGSGHGMTRSSSNRNFSGNQAGSGGGGNNSGGVTGAMGSFGIGPGQGGARPPPPTSEARFAQSTARMQSGGPGSSTGGGGGAFGGPGGFRQGSRGMGGSQLAPSRSKGSRQDSKRRSDNRGPSSLSQQTSASAATPEVPVEPLKPTANRWKPRAKASDNTEDGLLSPEAVQRKVNAMLNKMTLENFDKVSDQILEIANQSKKEKDGRTLRQVIALTFAKATDESHWANMYARFCHKMWIQIDPEISEEGAVDKNGQPFSGGVLFKKYLLSKCQEEFERGWKVDIPALPDETAPRTEELEKEVEEYYLAVATKRRGLGLIRFIGELYMQRSLSDKVIFGCIQKLVGDTTHPEEEEVESLCKLLTTCGASLDGASNSISPHFGRERMDVFFGRMEKMLESTSLSSRIKFMILDVIDLRKHQWKGKDTDKGPKTISQIHDEAARKQQEEARNTGRTRGGGGGQQNSGGPPMMSRDRSFGGGGLGPRGSDGWSSGGSGNNNNNNNRSSQQLTGDLKYFGRIRSQGSAQNLGPGSMFTRMGSGRRQQSNGGDSKDEGGSATSRSSTPATTSHANMFTLLGGGDEDKEHDK